MTDTGPARAVPYPPVDGAPAGPDRSRPAWFGHPPGLTILFLTEMWEKFSYFGMRAMLVYYMTRQLRLTQAHASLIYGAYNGAVMLAPLLGAPLADRWLGRRRAVILGAVIMAAGHFMMAFESLFYLALATIASGAGLLLPNLPSQIDGLYGQSDSRRDRAFNLYYLGINVGGLLAPFVCGTIGEIYGWHWGFTVAGAGMVIGLLTYVGGTRHLPRDDRPHPPRKAAQPRASSLDFGSTRAGARDRYRLLLLLTLVVTLFRGSYEQIGNTIAIWADSGIDRHLSGFIIPMTWFQSLNPLLIIVLTPALVALWSRRASRGREPKPLVKMTMGAALVGCAYFFLAGVSLWSQLHAARVNWTALLVFFVIITTGELYILPIGLALFARLAPAGFVATAIAIWYFAGFAGNLLGGAFGTLWTVLPHAAFFAAMGAVAAVAALMFLSVEQRSRICPEP